MSQAAFLQSLANSKVCYFTDDYMLIGSVACFALISQDGLSFTCGIKICKAPHLTVRKIAFEAMIYVYH